MWRRMWWWGRGSELRGPKAAAQESQTGFNSFDIPGGKPLREAPGEFRGGDPAVQHQHVAGTADAEHPALVCACRSAAQLPGWMGQDNPDHRDWDERDKLWSCAALQCHCCPS